MNLSENSIISKSEELLEAAIDESLALMSIEQGNYYGLNPVGKEIWENLNEPINIKNLVDLLLNKFDIDQETCQRETLIFLEKLRGKKVITIK